MSADGYRDRLKKAGWGWMEEHAWNQGRFPKDRRMSRKEKRGANQDVRREIKKSAATPKPEA